MLLYKLGYTTCLATIAFIRFYIGFSIYDHYYIITAYILLYHLCSIHQSPALNLIIPWVFPAWYISTCFVCLCSRHDFQCMFMFWIYQYTCAYLCTPPGIRITTCRGVLTPMDPHVQVSELEACEFSWLLIRVVQWKRVIGRPSIALSFQVPYSSLEFSFCNS